MILCLPSWGSLSPTGLFYNLPYCYNRRPGQESALTTKRQLWIPSVATIPNCVSHKAVTQGDIVSGHGGDGSRLDWVILDVLSNLNDSELNVSYGVTAISTLNWVPGIISILCTQRLRTSLGFVPDNCKDVSYYAVINHLKHLLHCC